MDLFNFLTMVGGLALFLYGMHALGEGLSKMSGGKLEKLLEKLTSNPIKAVLLGAGVTAAIQSSSATTVMVVGFVNSGIMKLSQAVGIIMGANVGTTATAWILSLSGIEGSNIFLRLLKPSSFSPVLAIIGVVFLLFTKKEKKHNIGTIFIGFAILMFGMEIMSAAVKPLAEVPEFVNILTLFKNPFFGVLAGALLTAVIQSSSASVGILQALCVTGAINFSVALPIIMGQNIGTCITAILSCIGTSKNAKRTALVHLYFNLIGTIIFMAVYYGINAFVHFSFADQVASPAGIAVIHSIFNVFATLILLPFSKVLVKLAYLTIKEDTKEAEVSKVDADFLMLDPRFLETPGFALEQCKVVTTRMAEWAQKGLQASLELLEHFDETKYQEIFTIENCVDQYEDRLGTYLVKLSSKNLSEKDSRTLSILLHCIGDFERISDHSINIAESYKEMFDKKLTFSDKAVKELEILNRAVSDIIECSVRAFKEEDLELARKVEPIEEVIDLLKFEIKKRHTKRLQKGKCTIELGFVLTDLITNLERVSDHCSNIAVFILQTKETAFDTHEYLEMVKRKDNDDFNMRYELYKQRYMLP